MFLQASVCPQGGACVVAPGGGHAWFYWGGMRGCSGGGQRAWLLPGGMHGFIGGACVVLFWGGMHGFILGGMHGFIWGGMHGFIRGGAWFFQFFRIQWDTVNERAVRILLECILVHGLSVVTSASVDLRQKGSSVWGHHDVTNEFRCPQMNTDRFVRQRC